MTDFAILNTDGSVIRVEHSDDAPEYDHAVLAAFTGVPARPDWPCSLVVLDGVLAWSADARPLAERRGATLASLKTARDGAIYGGFTWDGSGFDSDQVAQTRLLGLFVAAQTPAYEPTAWRLADNSWRVMAAADAAAAYAALAAHLRAQFETFAALEAAVAAATTILELEAITWPA